jgi:hypothetical protein
MLRYKLILLLSFSFLALSNKAFSQEEENTEQDSTLMEGIIDITGREDEAREEATADSTAKPTSLTLGIAIDYLKFHTLLLDDSEKWEAAINFRFYDRVSLTGAYGLTSLSPTEGFRNAEYLSEGNYFRVGIDYHFTIKPGNYLIVGARYSGAQYDETIQYQILNPLFESTANNIDRQGLSATWFEFVLTSEKDIRTLFKKKIPDFLSVGFKFRLKTALDYTQFERVDTYIIPGYGLTNANINPEFNLYLKFRLNIF